MVRKRDLKGNAAQSIDGSERLSVLVPIECRCRSETLCLCKAGSVSGAFFRDYPRIEILEEEDVGVLATPGDLDRGNLELDIESGACPGETGRPTDRLVRRQKRRRMGQHSCGRTQLLAGQPATRQMGGRADGGKLMCTRRGVIRHYPTSQLTRLSVIPPHHLLDFVSAWASCVITSLRRLHRYVCSFSHD
jgi:hypothetical protein